MVLITIVIGAYKPTNITLFVGSWLLDYLGFQKRGRERERATSPTYADKMMNMIDFARRTDQPFS